MQNDTATRRRLNELIADSRQARQRARAMIERAEEVREQAAFLRQRPKLVYDDVLPDRRTD